MAFQFNSTESETGLEEQGEELKPGRRLNLLIV